MTVELKGGNLVITIAAETVNPQPSKSMKTLLVATTHGNHATTTQVLGKPLTVAVNAYIPR